MSRPGRALRQEAADRAAETPARAAERVRARAAGEQAHREMLERFAPLTAENAGAALAWQESRIRELGGRS